MDEILGHAFVREEDLREFNESYLAHVHDENYTADDDEPAFFDDSIFDTTLLDESANLSDQGPSTSTMYPTSEEEISDEEEIPDVFAEKNLVPYDDIGVPNVGQYDIFESGCGCSRKCVEKFPEELIIESYLSCNEMNYTCGAHVNHLSLFLQGSLNALYRTGVKTQKKQHAPKERKAGFTEYSFRGVVVCAKFFQFVNGVGEKRLKNIKKSLLTDGVGEKMHKNACKSTRAVSFEKRSKAVKFILHFAQQNGLVLPGRLPQYRNNPNLLLLPSTMSKTYVYDKYCQLEGAEAIGKRMWYLTWKEFCSNVVIQRPRSDLCTVCQQSVMSLGRLAALPEYIKQERIQASLSHLTTVDDERAYYRKITEQCHQIVMAEMAEGYLRLERCAPCSWDGRLHISFDYAQQILLPFDAQQVGPIYFLAGFKVALFGIAIEPLHRFILYIIPESCSTGKGANTVISLLHHFFDNFSLGENDVFMHADNCTGQNKNRFMLQYCAWRVATERHKKMRLSFMPVGHTKFAPDIYFGLFKKTFRHSSVHSLKQVAEVAVQATSRMNSITPVIVGSEDGTVHIPTYDWIEYFNSQRLKTVPGITKKHHFVITDDEIGVIRHRELRKSTTQKTAIFKWNKTSKNSFKNMPPVVPAAGLSQERKQYLYKKIRPFVKRSCAQILCPKP